MLIVRPIQDKEIQKALCSRAGIAFEPLAFAYFAAESEDMGQSVKSYIGVLQFDICGENAELCPTASMPDTDDMEAMIIMGRAAMSFMHRSGAKKLSAKLSVCSERYLRAFGFLGSGEELSVDLELFFKSPCSYNAAHGDVK